MKKKITHSIIFLATLGASSVLMSTLVQAAFYSPQKDLTLPPPPAASTPRTALNPKEPAKLRIPTIEVDAEVQKVGLAASGRMAVPTNYTDVGWFRSGPLPGELGSAVMDGHADNGFGFGAVFKDINKLEVGNDIYVEAENGSKLRFVVEKVETYLESEVPLDTLFNRADTARLNLITCSGNFDGDKKSYDSRTVVYTTLAE